MKLDGELKKNILFVVLGTFVLGGIMLLIFGLLGLFSSSVVLGTLIGCTTAGINFVLLAASLQKAVSSTKSAGKAFAGISYTFRNLMMLAIGLLSLWLLRVNAFALLIPYIFPRLSILVLQVTGLYKNNDLSTTKEDGEPKDGS